MVRTRIGKDNSICVYIPEDLMKILRERAKEEDRSVSGIIRYVLKKWLEEEKRGD